MHHRFKNAVMACVAVAVCRVWLAPEAAAQAPPSKPYYLFERAEASTANEHCYAVMGAVARAGVYGTKLPRVSVQDLLAQAGGVAEDAHAMLRVVRSSGTVFHLDSRTAGREQLLRGDTLVVPRGRGQQFAASSEVLTGPEANAPAAPEYIELALLNVAERPVVVSLRQGLARLPDLMGLLGQSTDLIEHVGVVPGDSSYTGMNDLLPTGSVILFDQSKLDARRLSLAPPFPPTIAWKDESRGTPQPGSPQATKEPPQVMQPAAVPRDASSAHSGSPLSLPKLSDIPSPLPQRPAAVPLMTAEHETKPVDAGSVDRSAPLLTDRVEAKETPRPVLSTPHILEVPDASAAKVQVNPSVQANRLAPQSVEPEKAGREADQTVEQAYAVATISEGSGPIAMALPLRPETAPVGARSSEKESGIAADVADAASAEHATSLLDLVMIVLVSTIFAACCFGISMGWTRWERQREAAQRRSRPADSSSGRSRSAGAAKPPVEVDEDETLEPLVRNELPLINEQVLLPRGMDLHGDAVGKRRLIVDGPHELAGPHFATWRSRKRSRQVVAAGKTAVEQTTQTNQGLRPAAGKATTTAARRVDAPEPVVEGVQTPPRSTAPRSGGDLLCRVLQAMEQEHQK